jgi:serine/threonine protein kinase
MTQWRAANPKTPVQFRKSLMLAINDLICGKLVIQMRLAPTENVRSILSAINEDFDSAFDLPNRLFEGKFIDEDKIRRLRSFVALYNYVRSESLYLRILERQKSVSHGFIQRLVALLEAEWYRRRVGDFLLTIGQIQLEEDQSIRAKVLRQIDVQDRKILNRYRSEGYKKVSSPLLPGKSVNVDSFRLSKIFRGKQTRTFVQKHLKKHENTAASIEKSITREFVMSQSDVDFGDIWALPDDICLDHSSETRAAKKEEQENLEDQISVLLPPRVRAPNEAFTSTIIFNGTELSQSNEAYIDDYLIVGGPQYEAIGQAFYQVTRGDETPLILQSIDPRVAPAKAVARFVRQLKVLQRLNHDNCLRLIDHSVRPGGMHYMVLPELKGQTIAERLKSTGPFDMVEAFSIAERVLDALVHIHKHEFIHRDLQTDGILLLDDNPACPVIKDFRLVWLSKSALPASVQAYTTRADELLGNSAYLAPETVTNDPIDQRTDLYSFAIVFFEMLTGALPLRASSPEDYLNQHLIGQPYTLAEARPDIAWAPELESWIATALAKNRKHRQQSSELAQAQLLALKNKAISAAAHAPDTVSPDPKALVSGIFNEFFKQEI